MGKDKGLTSIVLVIVILLLIILTVYLFAGAMYISNIVSIMHNIKQDMFLINRSGIGAVNKQVANIDLNSINEEEYSRYFKESLQKNYNLNNNLESSNGLIERIDILEYKFLKANEFDSITKKYITEPTIHCTIRVKIKTFIFANTLENINSFLVHEDVIIKNVKL